MRRARRAPATVAAAAFAVASLASAVSATGCSTAALRDAYTALDESGNRKRDVFYTDTSVIYCVAEFSSGREDVTVETLIRQTVVYDAAADRTREVDSVVALTEHAPGRSANANLAVSLTPRNPDGTVSEEGGAFPVGEYLCEVYLDGELQTSIPFRVDYPACPAYLIELNSRCGGFYKPNTVCPAFGSSSLDKSTCKCTDGLWQC